MNQLTYKTTRSLLTGMFVFGALFVMSSVSVLAHENTSSGPVPPHKHCPANDEDGPSVPLDEECPEVEGSTTGTRDGAVETEVVNTEPKGEGAVETDPAPGSPTEIVFTNPIDPGTVDELLARVLTTIQSIVAILAILFIVIGAILYITSGGNQQRTELAKNAIFAAFIGLALALAAPSFLKEIYTAIGGDPTNEIIEARSLTEIALNITKFLLSLVGVLSILMLVSGGIIYILSGGDQTRTDTAKKMIVYAIIGLVVALVSLVVVTQVVGVIAGA